MDMKQQLSEQAKRVLNEAQREAHELNHDYVGTEHLLLAILVERPEIASMLGVGIDAIRGEIAKEVTRGLVAAPPGDLPLTPRALRVINHAVVEAKVVTQSAVDVEHLLVGLINEPDGVAGQALRNLGLSLEQVRRQMHKLCLEQMAIVERAVRPLRCGARYKRKIREELLAHLNGIFEEERATSNDPHAALVAASKRFGDPVALSRQLESALPWHERMTYLAERWFGWRAPESATRMMLRVSLLTGAIFCGFMVLIMGLTYVLRGSRFADGPALRTLAAMAFLLPVAQFLIGVCYYRIRDSFFGVFGSAKSTLGAIVFAVLLALSMMACSVAAIALINASFAPALELAVQIIVASIGTAIVCTILARQHGTTEIRDVVWACLDVA